MNSNAAGTAVTVAVTVVSSTPFGTIVMPNSRTGMDVACTDTPRRLPIAMTTPVGAVAAFTAADVIGSDGAMDIVARLVNGTVVVAANDGRFNFTALSVGGRSNSSNSSTSAVLSWNCTALAVWDVNNDGTVEVVMWSVGADGSSVDVAASNATTLASSPALASAVAALSGGGGNSSMNSTINSAVVVDVSGDGVLDVVTSSLQGCRVLLGGGSGVFSDGTLSVAPAGFVTSPSSCVVVADVDSDGDVDVLVCEVVAPPSLWLNTGNGTVVAGHWQLTSAGRVGVTAATSASFGDVDNDGDLDLLLAGGTNGNGTATLYVNNGAGVFSVSTSWSGLPVPVAAVFADVTLDGAVDVPAVTWFNPLPPPARSQSVYVRVVSRAGTLSCYGATVCLAVAGSTALIGCRVVDGGGQAAQAPYDVHFGLPTSVVASGAVDVTVSYGNGRVGNSSTAAAYGGVSLGLVASTAGNTIVVQDVPAVAALVTSPSSGVLAIGGRLVVRIVARWGDSGLLPDPDNCCLVNGVDVSSTWRDLGGGVYTGAGRWTTT